MKLHVRGKKYHIRIHQHIEKLPSLFLLHGFMGSGRVFDHLVKPLSAFSNPVTIDLLGHASTEGALDPDRFSEQAQVSDLSVILQSFQPDPVFLHGYSMGGRLALRYALRHPETIRGLILESTTYGIEDAGTRSNRRQQDEERARAIESDFESFLKKWSSLPLFNNGIEVPPALSKIYAEIQLSQQPVQMANCLRGFGSGVVASVKDSLKALEPPALFLAGQADDKYVTIAREMHEIVPDSLLAIASGAGHRVHMEQPDEWISIVESFITKHFSP